MIQRNTLAVDRVGSSEEGLTPNRCNNSPPKQSCEKIRSFIPNLQGFGRFCFNTNGYCFPSFRVANTPFLQTNKPGREEQIILGNVILGQGTGHDVFPVQASTIHRLQFTQRPNRTSTTSTKSCLLSKEPIHLVLSGRLLVTSLRIAHLQSILMCVAL